MFGFLAQLLAWCYTVIPNYGVAIIMFTLIVMLAVTPFTVKGMRSMAEMARLQPEMKRLQDQYKNDRVKMNEEMQALFKEHKVNPLGGCLPTLLPLPIFFIIFRLLRGLGGRHSHTIFNPQRVLNGLPNPHYLVHTSSLYQHLVASGGRMVSFGMDLARSARETHGTKALPFYALIVVMTISQYVQQQQMNKRNPQAAAANPQMKLTMQLFPAFYAVISLTIPASVVLYLFVSGLYRMAQNMLSYKYDPKMALPPLPPGGKGVIDAPSRPSGGGGRNGRAGRDGADDGGRGPKDAPPGGRGFLARARAAAAGLSGAARSDEAARHVGPPKTPAKGPAKTPPRGQARSQPKVPVKSPPKSASTGRSPNGGSTGSTTSGAGGGKDADEVSDQSAGQDSAKDDSGGITKKAVNVKPGGARPSSGRVTPRGAGDHRPRRGR